MFSIYQYTFPPPTIIAKTVHEASFSPHPPHHLIVVFLIIAILTSGK